MVTFLIQGLFLLQLKLFSHILLMSSLNFENQRYSPFLFLVQIVQRSIEFLITLQQFGAMSSYSSTAVRKGPMRQWFFSLSIIYCCRFITILFRQACDWALVYDSYSLQVSSQFQDLATSEKRSCLLEGNSEKGSDYSNQLSGSSSLAVYLSLLYLFAAGQLSSSPLSASLSLRTSMIFYSASQDSAFEDFQEDSQMQQLLQSMLDDQIELLSDSSSGQGCSCCLIRQNLDLSRRWAGRWRWGASHQRSLAFCFLLSLGETFMRIAMGNSLNREISCKFVFIKIYFISIIQHIQYSSHNQFRLFSLQFNTNPCLFSMHFP